MITVKKYTINDKALWDNFVKSAKNATFLFQRDFMEYHSDRFIDYSLLCFKDDELIAVLPANRKEDEVYSHQGLTYGGLVVDYRLRFSAFFKAFKTILDFLAENKVKSLYLKQLPEIYSSFPSEEMEYLHFILKSELVRTDVSSSLYLENELKYSKDRLAGVKRGEKSQLIVKEVNDFEEFWNEILIPNLLAKHNTRPTHSCKEITQLKSSFPKNIRQFNVYKGDEIVGGTTIFETDRVVHSQYMSAIKEKNSLGTLDFLHHYLFTKTFYNKAIFDFGISNENGGKNMNEGLLYWKEGFGARTKLYKQYKVSIANKELLNTIMI